MSIVQGISKLERIDSISPSLLDLVIDLSGRLPVLIHSILKLDFTHIPHRLSTHQVVPLSKDSFYLRMFS
jgi:hypothetical protein